MKKRFIVLLLIAAVALPIFAEGQKEADTGEVELECVAFTCQDLQNPFFKLMGDAVRKAAYDIGGEDVRVLVESGDNDLNKQFRQIDDFIAAGADIIVLNACDSAGIAPAVKRAKDAGIVVIASDVTADGGVDATMTSNNFDAGYIVAEYIAEKLNGKGDVVAICGDPVSASLDRKNGFDACMEEYPEINVLSDSQNGKGRRELSMNLMSDLLTAFPKIDAVWCVNDPTALGAELAIKQAKRADEMFVVGVDGSPDAAKSMKLEGSIFEASAAQDPYYMAYHAVEVGWDVMNGNPPEEKIELIPVNLVTQEDVANGYSGWAIPE